jgi:hypothetical protein
LFQTYIYKEGGEYTKRWQKRFFCIDGEKLYYKNSENDQIPKKTFTINNIKCIKQINDTEYHIKFNNSDILKLKFDDKEDACKFIVFLSFV